MKEIICILLIGVVIQQIMHIQKDSSIMQISNEIVLLSLLFVIGISIGKNRENIRGIRKNSISNFALPVGIIIGSLVGGIVAGFFTHLSFHESLLVASGLGFYSVSSSIIAQKGFASLAAITFLSSSMREILAVILASSLAKIHMLAPVGAAGATASDIALPAIIKATSKEVGMVSFMSGFVITLLVPVLTTFLVTFT